MDWAGGDITVFLTKTNVLIAQRDIGAYTASGRSAGRDGHHHGSASLRCGKMIDKDKGDIAVCTYCGRTSKKESRSCPRCGNVFTKDADGKDAE